MTWRTWGGWLAALLVFAVSFELAARVEDWVRYDMPLDSPYRSEADLVVRDSLGMHGRADARYADRQWSHTSNAHRLLVHTRNPQHDELTRLRINIRVQHECPDQRRLALYGDDARHAGQVKGGVGRVRD